MTIGGPYDLVVAPNGLARFAGRRFVAALGLRGVAAEKREGDGATPCGVFRLEAALYRADRRAPPRGGAPSRPISRSDAWCDDPGSAAYNTMVTTAFEAGREALWRGDRRYDVIGVIDANRAPIIPGRGSAIFLHVALKPRYPTLGCIAFSAQDLDWILRRWRPRSRVIIPAPHAGFWRAPKSADPTRTEVAPIATAIS